jgi:curved DNA-binding protein
MEFKDYYQIMGLSKTATPEEIKRAYRKLARKYHPDVSKEPDAESKFKELGEAYEVLKDPAKRSKYDAYGQHWQQAGQQQYQQQAGGQQFYEEGNPADFEDFFSSLFGQRFQQGQARTKAQDTHAKLTISLEDSYTGAEKILKLDSARGSRSVKVKIPKGIQDGQQIRLKGQGDRGGNLYIEISIAPHPIFKLDGKDIYLQLPISPWEAALGATIMVPTLGGTVHLKIPKLSQTGKQLRLKDRGLPGSPAGNQHVILEIVIPPKENAEATTLYEQLAQTLPFNPREKLGAYYGKV